MDGYEINKFFGASVAALMVYVAVSLGVKAVFAPAYHADDAHLAYAIEIEEPSTEEEATEAEIPEVDLASLLAAADYDAGEKVFKKCKSCHKVGAGAANATGPYLTNIVGREIASVASFGKYSSALQDKSGVWDWQTLDAFLTKPKAWAAGTSMNFAGLKKPEDRANLLAWLNQQAESPVDLP